MGMSSSQARLLSLTARMHDIEYKAQNLEAQKLQMANESDAVYKEYENALNATKIQLKQISNDGSITYIDATYQNMLDNGYQIKFDGIDKILVSQATANNFVAAAGNKNYFIALETGRVTTTNQNVGGVTEIYTAEQLMNMSANGNYRLMSDIDLTGKNFTSLNLNGGNFDGNGYTIKGLDKALFSSVSNSTITNLRLDGDVTSCAILAETVSDNTNINNISVSGSINNNSKTGTGALIGASTGSNVNINQCNADVNIRGTAENVGGLIGKLTGGNVTNCSSSGNIEAARGIGGLIGWTSESSITNASSNIDISATDTSLAGGQNDSGGLIGVAYNNVLIDRSSAYGDVNIVGSVAGGFLGSTWGTTGVIIKNSNALGNVSTSGSGYVGGFIGDGRYTNVDNCYVSDTSNNFIGSTTGSIVTNTSSIPIEIPYITPPSIKQTTKIDNAGADEAAALFDEMQKNGYFIEGQDIQNPAEGYENDSNWFTNMLNMGFLFLFKRDNTSGEFYQTNVATDTNLQEVQDETDLKKAEAKYEADMRKINAKDKKFDTDLASLESERNAINTEMDTLKTVIKDNVDRSFKLFS